MTNDDIRRSTEDRRVVASGRNGPNVTLIGLAIIVVLFVVFFMQNGTSAVIHFLVFQKNTTVRWSILVAMLLGIAIDRVFTVWWRRRGRRPRIDV
jgi:uncharacterized integral membrane protein